VNPIFHTLCAVALTTVSCYAATMGVGNSITSSLIDTSGPANQPNNTSFTASNATVEAETSAWSIIPDAMDPFDFTASATSGQVSAVATGGGNRNPAGSHFTSTVIFSLGIGESAAFTFDMTYVLQESSSNAGAPSMSWSLVNTTTGNTVFSNSSTTSTTAATSVSIPTLSGSLIEAGTYVLEIRGELTASVNGNGKSSLARLGSTTFDVDVTIPEPTSVMTLAMGALVFFRRRRS